VEVLEQLTEQAITQTETPHGSIRFFAPSPVLASRAESLLTKEPDTIRWIDTMEKDSVFWDIGANVGVFSLYAACTRRLSVLAFEPSAPNFHSLARNVNLNQYGDRISAYCLALSGRTQLGTLNLASLAMGASMSEFGERGQLSKWLERESGVGCHGMVGFTIDDFIARFHPPFPNYIKIDVDGIEPAIIEGATRTLRDPRLKSLIVELSAGNNSEQDLGSIAALERSGLRLVSTGEVQRTQAASGANHLFRRMNAEVVGLDVESDSFGVVKA
jgi:FkbM family methyltransferase